MVCSHRLFFRAALFLAAVVVVRAQTPWTLSHQNGTGADLWGIASGPAGLVAVGTNGTILQSADGTRWTARVSGTTDWLTAVAYGNGHYIAVGDHGRILSSVDGATWSNVPQTATTQRLNNVAFAEGSGNSPPYPQFVAVGESGTILYSADGATWSAAASGTTNWLRGLAYAPGLGWVATGQAGTALMSGVGTTWSNINSGVSFDLETITYVAADASRPLPSTLANPSHFTLVAAGATGTADILTVTVPFVAPPSESSSTVALNSSARIRAIASGPRSNVSYLQGDIFRQAGAAYPVVAVDEAGNAFSLYDSAATSAWREEPSTATGPMRAGTYSAATNSFFFVGDHETIFERTDVFNGRAANISTRGFVDQGDKSLIAGFVVGGHATKQLLLRAVGPGLANFGVTNPMAQPILTLYAANGDRIISNSGWTTNAGPAIAAAAARVGAFPLGAGSHDAALLIAVDPGAYTAQITSADGSSGVALIEAYDLDPAVNGTSRAINLSTRGFVGTGENALIAGISVQRPEWRRFLVRAVGLSLARFGVSAPLADPALDLKPGPGDATTPGVTISRDPVAIAAATTAAGAFVLLPGADDDAMIVTLPPANYTVRVTSKSGGTGVGLVEIYDLGIAQ